MWPNFLVATEIALRFIVSGIVVEVLGPQHLHVLTRTFKSGTNGIDFFKLFFLLSSPNNARCACKTTHEHREKPASTYVVHAGPEERQKRAPSFRSIADRTHLPPNGRLRRNSPFGTQTRMGGKSSHFAMYLYCEYKALSLRPLLGCASLAASVAVKRECLRVNAEKNR